MSKIWPLFDLKIKTPVMELRIPSDEDIEVIADLAAKGIHGDEYLPFESPWSVAPSPRLEEGVMQYHWKCRADWAPYEWRAEFAVVVDETIIGTQGIAAAHFAQSRHVRSGSWLGQEFQGKGYGTQMRAAVLDFAFDHLIAVSATSGAHPRNTASLRVSQKLGYEESWTSGGEVPRVHLQLSEEVWRGQDRTNLHQIEVEGFDDCRTFFGI